MNIDSVFVGYQKIQSFSYMDGLLDIPLPAPATMGDTLESTVYYHGIPFVDPSNWGGFHFAGQYAFNLGIGFESDPHNLGRSWFPCVDDFHDRATYDVYGRVENDKKAVGGGTLISVVDNGDNTSTWHWALSQTIPAYLASIAVGNYSLVADTFQGANASVPITYYVQPSQVSKVNGTFLHMKDILAVYESHFGPYPFERAGITATALGAMEHATSIAFPNSGITGNLSSEWWYAHEMSHMWFGDMVTCASAEDMWMNEGWAVWCESLFREGIYSNTEYRDNIRSKLREVLRFTHIADNGYRALYGIPAEYTYGSTVYDKGGIVVHTLRNYLGDSLFFGGIKAYLQQYAYNYATSYNLRDFLSDYSGINLADFFDAWVFRPGFPQFGIDSVNVTPDGNNFNASVFVRQKLKGVETYANSNRLEVTFMGPQWQMFSDTLSFSGEYGSKTFSVPFHPMETMADLNEKIADATTDVAKVIKTIGEIDFPDTYSKIIVEQVPDSAFVRITHNWVAPDSLKIPVPGLRLSDYRHWKVEGILPEGFIAKGRFVYNRNNYLDNSLLLHSDDSLVILFRKGTSENWRPASSIKSGNYSTGSFIVDSLQCGEYTLAVYDKTMVGLSENPLTKKVILISPNPTSDYFNLKLDFKGSGYLKVINASGVIVDSIPLSPSTRIIKWHADIYGKGTYIFQVWTKNSKLLGTVKGIYSY
jgi:aminopeptidase N